jgi:hypothetical protein
MSEIAGTSREWGSRNFRRRDELVLAWSQWLERVPWELFVTLTFDPKRVFPVDRNMPSREAFWWCCETSRIHRTPIACSAQLNATGHSRRLQIGAKSDAELHRRAGFSDKGVNA